MTLVESRSAKLAVLAVAGAVLAAVAVVYVVHAAGREDPRRSSRIAGPATAAGTVDLAASGRLLFRSTALGPDYGFVASVPAAEPGGPRTFSRAECERFYAAAGTGVCLVARRGALTTFSAVVTDAGLRAVRTFELPGAPNRARVSASGRMVSWTVFVTGDSYAGNSFSTRTAIFDTRTGALVPSLEELTVYRNGARYSSPDENFWGVTFTADDNRFYATLGTRGKRYLVEGDFARRQVRTLRENVECPSLSPDGTRLVYKKKVSSNPARPWRLHVLDLAAMRDTELAEARSVDDQAAWLDDRTVGYALPDGAAGSDIWSVPADGTGTPELAVRGGFSPSPLR